VARDRERPKAVGALQTGASLEDALIETIRAGYRARDAAKVMSAYADNVECTIVNRNNPPSKPMVLRGRDAVKRMVEDLCAREMTHEISRIVVGRGSIAYRIECRYPDGCNVVGIYMATVVEGRIASEFSVDCWDE
jgi:hypothetical protein